MFRVLTGMVPFSKSGAFGSENAYTSVLCESGTPAKGLAGVVVFLLTMFRFGYPISRSLIMCIHLLPVIGPAQKIGSAQEDPR